MFDIVLGAQYGDEGKGRIVDYLCSTGGYDTCVRFNGSDNAGHTIGLKDLEDKFAFNQIPIGAIHGMRCVVARGCVLDLERLDEEIKRVEAVIQTHGRPHNWSLYIDERCHIKTQAHRDRDAADEKERFYPIGTTLSGNGPAYSDKCARANRRMCDIDVNRYPNIARRAIVCDTSLLGYEKCLVEGAHAVMLDIDHGTYPFVTSSACTAAAACHSIGVFPKIVGRIIGVAKPYITRIGAGAFPTEIKEKVTRETIRERGREYGTNTKRPRRIGWLDLPALAYSVRVSGITEIALCKTDIMRCLDSDISICVEYQGVTPEYVPARDEDYQSVNPIYDLVRWDDAGLVDMIRKIQRATGVPVSLVTDAESVVPR